MLTCPLCQNIIEKLDYSQEVTEYGTMNKHGEMEVEQTELQDNCNPSSFSCPSCHGELFDDYWEAYDFVTGKTTVEGKND
jgi:hypothetical protein